MPQESVPLGSPESMEHLEKLPGELDTDTTLFAYGYLLDVSELKELIAKKRTDFAVLETTQLDRALKLRQEHPDDIVILRGVRLEGVRASVVTEEQLRGFYRERGESVEALVQKGLLEPAPRQHSYLYARVAEPDERGRFLDGGLIAGLRREELEEVLDPYELPPVYRRQRVPGLTIEGKRFKPERVTFYAGNIGKLRRATKEIVTAKETARVGRAGLGEYGTGAKWPREARHKG